MPKCILYLWSTCVFQNIYWLWPCVWIFLWSLHSFDKIEKHFFATVSFDAVSKLKCTYLSLKGGEGWNLTPKIQVQIQFQRQWNPSRALFNMSRCTILPNCWGKKSRTFLELNVCSRLAGRLKWPAQKDHHLNFYILQELQAGFFFILKLNLFFLLLLFDI